MPPATSARHPPLGDVVAEQRPGPVLEVRPTPQRVDDGAGGTFAIPQAPWRFSDAAGVLVARPPRG
jgi:hypothetical protein